MQRNSSTLKGTKNDGKVWGYIDHSKSAKISAITGERKKINMFDLKGIDCSLVNSFSASAIGWGIPIRLTLFGPFRIWK